MSLNTLKILSVYLFCMQIIVKADLSEFKINPEWERPDAWSRQKLRLAKENNEVNDDENYELNPIKHFSEADDTCDRDRDTLETSKLFYKRLAHSLFNEGKFKVISSYYGKSMKVILNFLTIFLQETDSGFLIRTIQIKVEKDRLQLINSLIDDDESDKLTDLDEHITKVIRQSEGGLVQVVKEEIFSSFEKFYVASTQFTNQMLQHKTVSLSN